MALEVYIEVVILDNLFFNYCLLNLSARWWLPRPKRSRVLLGAIIGTVYAVVAPLRAFYFLQNIVFKVVISAVMVYSMGGISHIFDFGKRMVSFYVAAALMAGCLYVVGGLFFKIRVSGGLMFFSGPPLWLMLVSGAVFVWVAERVYLALKRSAGAQANEARISVRVGSCTVVVKALIDTGSSLCDPISGLPVILLPNEPMDELYPDGIYSVTGEIRFNTVAGSGSVRAAKSDEIWLYWGSQTKRLEALIATATDLAQPVAIIPIDATLSL